MRRFISRILISFAVFVLTATLFVWTIDDRVLNQEVLSGELRKAGVSSELTKLLPDMFTGDKKTETPQGIQEIKDKISGSIGAEYVDGKISSITDSIITYAVEGEPQPVIDLSDFPEQLNKAGIDVDNEFIEDFSTPIQLNEEGNLDNIPRAYKTFSMLKYIGLGLFAVVMLIEWFVAERGKKLQRISRVFLYSGLSYLLYWGLLILTPIIFGSTLRSSVQAEYDASGLVDAIVRAVQGLFSSYFLTFAVGCLFIATILYLIRHFRHGDVVPEMTNREK